MSQKVFRAEVKSIVSLCQDVIEIQLAAPEGDPAFPQCSPGAHIELHLPNSMKRSYSIHKGEGGVYALGILNEEMGRGGSAWIHHNLNVGDVIDISGPKNNFPLMEDVERSYLIAGGIGITPIISMVRKLKSLRKPATLLYCARSLSNAAFIAELDDLAGDTCSVQYHFDDQANGLPDIRSFIASSAQADHLYCCGPARMLDVFEKACIELERPNFHIERFKGETVISPLEPSVVGGVCEVQCASSGVTLQMAKDEPILTALLSAGIDVDYSCTEGVCGACETRVISGECEHRDSYLSRAQKQAGDVVMLCVSRCKSDLLVLDI